MFIDLLIKKAKGFSFYSGSEGLFQYSESGPIRNEEKWVMNVIKSGM